MNEQVQERLPLGIDPRLAEVFEVAAILVQKGYHISTRSSIVGAIKEIRNLQLGQPMDWQLFHACLNLMKDFGLAGDVYAINRGGKRWLDEVNKNWLVTIFCFAQQIALTEIPGDRDISS